MPSKKREMLPEHYYHVFNRAVEKRTIFYSEKDYEFFINRIVLYKEKTGVRILAYCVLPNHWHFLLQEPTRRVENIPTRRVIPAVSEFISLLSNSYTKYFNTNKDHLGHIFQGEFKSKIVSDSSYMQSLVNYINLNPLKHKIVKKIDDWPYTSHQDFISKTSVKNLINNDYLVSFDDYKAYFKEYISHIYQLDEEF